MPRTYTPRPDWVGAAEPGTVLLGPTGDMRVIRSVSRGRHIRHPIFYFAIRRCSWTQRPYTLYSWGELVRMGYVALGVRVALKSLNDKQLDKQIQDHWLKGLSCCDVHAGQMP